MTKELDSIRFSAWATQTPPAPKFKLDFNMKRFAKRYGILLVVACLWTMSMVICSAIASQNTEKALRQEMAIEYSARLEAYKREQAEKVQAEHWLSGDASREAAINQAVDAVAPVIAKLSTDNQKLTEVSCMLARVMSNSYPNSFEEVAAQPQQWMFYNGQDNTCTQHDKDLAESIIRPYIESGIVPNGLNADLVYGEWSQNDFVLRDSYKTTSTMHTWRYS